MYSYDRRRGSHEPVDVDALLWGIRQASAFHGMVVSELGRVGSDPIMLVTPNPASQGPRLLVAAGFHGEEPAGCLGLLRFLQSAPSDLLQRVRLSLLPAVNLSGLRLAQREDAWGGNPNDGYIHPNSGELSREGAVLVDNLDQLVALGKDGFVSLHEDENLEDRFFIYTFERHEEPGPFTQMLLGVERRFFEPVPDGLVEDVVVVGGVAYRHHDGSFEDLLFHRGVPRTACTETPGKTDLALRVEVNQALVEAFCRFSTWPQPA